GALLAAALERRLGGTGLALRLSAKIAMATLLLVIHVFALFFYGALLAAIAFGPRFAAVASTRGPAGAVRGAAAPAAPAAIPALVFVLLVPALPGAHVDAAGNAPWWDFSLQSKLHVLLTPVVTYERAIDLAVLAVVLAPLACALIARKVEMHAGLLLAAAALTALGLASPT